MRLLFSKSMTRIDLLVFNNVANWVTVLTPKLLPSNSNLSKTLFFSKLLIISYPSGSYIFFLPIERPLRVLFVSATLTNILI